jgi:hypothetical protein
VRWWRWTALGNLLSGSASTMLRFKTDEALPPALAAQARVTGRIVQVKAHDAAEVERLLAVLREAGVKWKTWRSAAPTWKTCSSRSCTAGRPQAAPAQPQAVPA